jgi:hypothetical protein
MYVCKDGGRAATKPRTARAVQRLSATNGIRKLSIVVTEPESTRVEVTTFWNATPCSLVWRYVPNYTASYSRRVIFIVTAVRTPNLIEVHPNPPCIRSVLVLSFRLQISRRPSSYLTIRLYIYFVRATCPAHFTLSLDHPSNTVYEILKFFIA